MSYQTFLNNITNIINNIITLLATIYNSLMGNYIFKTIVYTILILLIIEYFGKILSFIKNIFSMKKEAGKNKTNSNTDIE